MNVSGVLHMHSTHSYDGKVPLNELKALLIAEGISFACMSEHTDEMTLEGAQKFVQECRELSDDSFVFIPGFEVPYKDSHILMFGCEEFLGQVAADERSLRDWSSAAALTILAHPVRNKYLLDETMREVIDGVEVWNQQYDGKRVPRPRAFRLLETLRKECRGLIATGGLDLHRPEHLTFPRVVIDVQNLTESDVMNTLCSGKFSFGNGRRIVNAKGEWGSARSFSVAMQSAVSIGIIGLGKTVNRGLASLGLSFPKSLKQTIRSQV